MKNPSSTPEGSVEDNCIRISVAGMEWRLGRPADLEQLWEAMGPADFADERIPYWTEIWPASLVLAHWLHMRRQEIRNRICLDLGCGMGLTALMASCLGAKVLAVDYELQALQQGSANAAANSVGQPWWVAMDWRAPAVRKNAIQLLWAGDVLYEKRFMQPVLQFMEYALAKQGEAWFAEPGRQIFRQFPGLAASNGWECNCVFSEKVRSLHPQAEPITVRIWQTKRKN